MGRDCADVVFGVSEKKRRDVVHFFVASTSGIHEIFVLASSVLNASLLPLNSYIGIISSKINFSLQT